MRREYNAEKPGAGTDLGVEQKEKGRQNGKETWRVAKAAGVLVRRSGLLDGNKNNRIKGR